jgi:hypothetical protein
MQLLRQPSAMVLAGDAPRAAITVDGEVKGSLARPVVLAAIAFGWLEPVGAGGGRVRKFRAGATAIEAAYQPQMMPPEVDGADSPARRQYKFGHAPNPIEALLRREQDLMTVEHLRIAHRFQLVYLHRETATAEDYAAIARAVPPRLLRVLDEVCGRGTGFQTLERKMKLPARSAKAIVALALEAVDHAGVAA